MSMKTDRLVTLFGGGGFIGRYAVRCLLAAGARVRIADRNPERAYFLRTQGGLGQFEAVRADITDPASAAAAVQGAEAVINLVGILKGDFRRVHRDGAENVARAAASAGARSLVHISALGADPESASAYGRSKGEGEVAVREAFPGATILRPAIVFGAEDDFSNKFARMARWLPLLPVIRGGWQLQPVHVADLGRAIALAALEPSAHGGQTYDIAGPNVTTMRDFNRWVARAAGHPRGQFDIPDPIAKVMARVGGFLPGAPLTWDQWLMLQTDSVADPARPGLEAFGIRPTPLEAVAEEWLMLFRRHGRFAKAPSA